MPGSVNDLFCYKKMKQYDADNKRKTTSVELRNNNPALILKQFNTRTGELIKKSDPLTGELIDDVDEIGFDIPMLNKLIAQLQEQLDNVKVLKKDAEALLGQ